MMTPEIYLFSPTLPPDDGSGADGWSPETPCNKKKKTVLVVDDEELIAQSVAEILRSEGFEAKVALSGTEALETAKELCPEVVLSDVLMPGMDGVETAIAIRKACPSTRVVLFSGQASTSDLLKKAEADGYQFELLPKPLHPVRLLAALGRLM